MVGTAMNMLNAPSCPLPPLDWAPAARRRHRASALHTHTTSTSDSLTPWGVGAEDRPQTETRGRRYAVFYGCGVVPGVVCELDRAARPEHTHELVEQPVQVVQRQDMQQTILLQITTASARNQARYGCTVWVWDGRRTVCVYSHAWTSEVI